MSSTTRASDAATQQTDVDALTSRASAASLGYFPDPYASHFLSPSARRSLEKRPALINIGTHARTWAVDQLVEQFLTASAFKGKGRQVLSLGAGTDTRYWRMRDKLQEWDCEWVEVDFEEATAGKVRKVMGHARMKELLGGDVKLTNGGTGLSSRYYSIVPSDLRTLPSLSQTLLGDGATLGVLDPSLPTLLLAECVLVYLPPASTSALLSWFASSFNVTGSCSVAYDPFGLEDSFGQVMLRNLAMRGLELPSALVTPTLESLNQRLLDAGFSKAQSLTVAQIRATVIPAPEISRVAKIEMLDEVEELNLVLDHYGITWGTVASTDSIEWQYGL